MSYRFVVDTYRDTLQHNKLQNYIYLCFIGSYFYTLFIFAAVVFTEKCSYGAIIHAWATDEDFNFSIHPFNQLVVGDYDIQTVGVWTCKVQTKCHFHQVKCISFSDKIQFVVFQTVNNAVSQHLLKKSCCFHKYCPSLLVSVQLMIELQLFTLLVNNF